MHVVWPAEGWKDPVAQSVQILTAEASENFPTAHLVQELGLQRLARIAERAALLDMIVRIHREETQSEPADVIATHGQSATELLARGTSHDLGALTASQAFAMLGNDGPHLDRCLMGRQDAELVALGVGQDHPGGIALPNVNERGS